MAELLVSVRCALEALAALSGGASVIDVKEPSRGALGRAEGSVWGEVLEAVAGRAPVSAALGELVEWGEGADPGTGPTADPRRKIPGLGGLSFLKLGLAGEALRPDWPEALGLSERVCEKVVSGWPSGVRSGGNGDRNLEDSEPACVSTSARPFPTLFERCSLLGGGGLCGLARGGCARSCADSGRGDSCGLFGGADRYVRQEPFQPTRHVRGMGCSLGESPIGGVVGGGGGASGFRGDGEVGPSEAGPVRRSRGRVPGRRSTWPDRFRPGGSTGRKGAFALVRRVRDWPSRDETDGHSSSQSGYCSGALPWLSRTLGFLSLLSGSIRSSLTVNFQLSPKSYSRSIVCPGSRGKEPMRT